MAVRSLPLIYLTACDPESERNNTFIITGKHRFLKYTCIDMCDKLIICGLKYKTKDTFERFIAFTYKITIES